MVASAESKIILLESIPLSSKTFFSAEEINLIHSGSALSLAGSNVSFEEWSRGYMA